MPLTVPPHCPPQLRSLPPLFVPVTPDRLREAEFASEAMGISLRHALHLVLDMERCSLEAC